jgi:D-alanyl-D-alanine carboxypeptidase
MRNKFTLILILLSIVSCTSNKAIAQKNYKGGTKHKQLEIESLPKETEYFFDKRLNDTLEIKLNQKVDELFNKYDIAGITATILIPKKGIWETNRGFISKPDNIVIDSSSVFYWASVSKLITSTLIHKLVLEDKLSFNDKLSKWFPYIKYSKKITIAQLLTHTNGIYSFNADSTVHFSNKHFSPNELLTIAQSLKKIYLNLANIGHIQTLVIYYWL